MHVPPPHERVTLTLTLTSKLRLRSYWRYRYALEIETISVTCEHRCILIVPFSLTLVMVNGPNSFLCNLRVNWPSDNRTLLPGLKVYFIFCICTLVILCTSFAFRCWARTRSYFHTRWSNWFRSLSIASFHSPSISTGPSPSPLTIVQHSTVPEILVSMTTTWQLLRDWEKEKRLSLKGRVFRLIIVMRIYYKTSLRRTLWNGLLNPCSFTLFNTYCLIWDCPLIDLPRDT